MSEEYERALLGQILHKPSIIDDETVTEDMFSNKDYRLIFDAVLRARRDYPVADMVSVGEELIKQGHRELVTTIAAIDFVSTANAGFYATQLREEMQRKNLGLALRAGMESLKDTNKTTTELTDTIMSDITSALQKVHEPEIPSMEHIALPYLDIVSKRIQNRNSGFRQFAEFGIPALDSVVSEIRPGEVIVIAGRPGAGKTALALQLMGYSAKKLKRPCAFFSLEMLREEVMDRLVAQTQAVSVSGIRGGYLSETQSAAAKEVVDSFYSIPLSIYDGAHNLSLLRSQIRREKAVNDVKVVCIDYLGLIDLETSSQKPRWERMSEVSRTFKLLALELGIIVIEVVQMNRDADGVEPTLGVLRDSGAIEQDADRVILLHNTEVKTVYDGEKPTQVKAIVAKNRHGPCGKVLLSFDGRHVLFSEQEATHEDK